MATIARVEVGRFDYEQTGEFKFFKAPVRPSTVVRLTDENGVQGWGQSVPIETWTYETVESVETTLRHYLAPIILGAEPSDLAGAHARDGPRCGGLWNASRIVALLRGNNLLAFGSGLTDPDLSLAAIAHLFAWAGLDTLTALNGAAVHRRAGHDRSGIPRQWRHGPGPDSARARHYRRCQRGEIAEHRGTGLDGRVAASEGLIDYPAA